MSRPKMYRRIRAYPEYWTFSPDGSENPETVLLTLAEYETVRLLDFLGLTQEDCARRMDVSRTTVTHIYEKARHKLADALVNGKRVCITGGAYRIDDVPYSHLIGEKGEDVMRVAVTYDHGEVGRHFGRAEQFKIFDVRAGAVVSEQIIDTNGTGHGALAGFLRAAGVETLICGGIGIGARRALEDLGIRIFPGAVGDANDAVEAWLRGDLIDQPDFVCQSHEGGSSSEEHCSDCEKYCAVQSSDCKK